MLTTIYDNKTNFTLSTRFDEHLKTDYFQVSNFGFIKITASEKYPQTWYPNPNTIVPAGWFNLAISNSVVGDINSDDLQDIVLVPNLFPHYLNHYETVVNPIVLIQDKNKQFIDPVQIDQKSQLLNQHFLYRAGIADMDNDSINDFVISGERPRNDPNRESPYNTSNLPTVFWGSTDNKIIATKEFGDISEINYEKWKFGYNSGHNIAVGDFNGDKKSDFMSDNYVFESSQIQPRTFVTRFLETIVGLDKWQYPKVNASVAADFDNDGFDDLILSTMWAVDDGRFNGGDLKILFGSINGLQDGNLTKNIERKNKNNENIGTNYMATIDINGDGKRDFIFLEHDTETDTRNIDNYYSNGRLRLYINEGNRNFSEQTNLINDLFAGRRLGEGNIHVVDVNGDGWDDVILSDFREGKTAWGINPTGAQTTILINNKGRLDRVDPSSIAYVEPYQIEGNSDIKDYARSPLTRLDPIDIGNDGLIDFIGFVQTPLRAWPQVEQVYNYGYIVRATRPLGRNETNELLVGTDNSDKIFGYDGNDSIRGGLGNDTINGGIGVDYALYSGKKSEYRLTTEFVFDSVRNRDGVDTLINTERLRFTDKTIALDIEGNAGQAYRLYQAALDRTPDDRGLAGWINYMDNSGQLNAMAQMFIDSQEFRVKYGALDNFNFVNQLYLNVLDRNGEATGVNAWVGALNSGALTRAQVLVGFSESNENKANVIGQIKDGIAYNEYWLT